MDYVTFYDTANKAVNGFKKITEDTLLPENSVAFTVFVQNKDNDDYCVREYKIGKDITNNCYTMEQLQVSKNSGYSLPKFCGCMFKGNLYISNYSDDTILLKNETELKEKFLYEKEKSLNSDIKIR